MSAAPRSDSEAVLWISLFLIVVVLTHQYASAIKGMLFDPSYANGPTTPSSTGGSSGTGGPGPGGATTWTDPQSGQVYTWLDPKKTGQTDSSGRPVGPSR